MSDPKINLNVGGRRFTTYRSTLNRDGNSLFEQLRSTIEASDGGNSDSEEYFFDRNSTYFEYILEYLRSGSLCHIPPDDVLLERLIEEAKFYRLKNMEEFLEAKLGDCRFKRLQMKNNEKSQLRNIAVMSGVTTFCSWMTGALTSNSEKPKSE